MNRTIDSRSSVIITLKPRMLYRLDHRYQLTDVLILASLLHPRQMNIKVNFYVYKGFGDFLNTGIIYATLYSRRSRRRRGPPSIEKHSDVAVGRRCQSSPTILRSAHMSNTYISVIHNSNNVYFLFTEVTKFYKVIYMKCLNIKNFFVRY